VDLRTLLQEPGVGGYPVYLRPYTAPLTQSIAAPPGTKLMPSRSGTAEREQAIGDSGTGLTLWTPWGLFSADDQNGYQLHSSPLGVPTQPRPVLGVAYAQTSALWKLSGVADGWSMPYGQNPGRKPTTKLALGNWTPFAGGSAPLPSNPAPTQMIQPLF
jgi:hypothetical protein